jgi:hypothetical protein
MSYTPMTSHLPKTPMPGEKNFRKIYDGLSFKIVYTFLYTILLYY